MRQKYFFPLSVQFQNIVITIILITLALFFRFYKLGEWSFDIDEVATQIEVRSFFDHQPLPEAVEVQSAYHPDLEKSQFYRLPQLIFVAHFVHRLNNRFFGNDEWGSR
ncbi:MAG: hypothetical protein LBT09_02220, partial [Planctomycetaceae bacterium]|nr:hypothetical protein [Planctomycetaceae bacterium]